MSNYNEIARKINNHIEISLGNLSCVYMKEQESLEIVTMINSLRSSELSQDVLSDYVMKSQSLVIAQIVGITDKLLIMEEDVSREGREKQTQEDAKIAAQRRKEQEEKEGGDDSNV